MFKQLTKRRSSRQNQRGDIMYNSNSSISNNSKKCQSRKSSLCCMSQLFNDSYNMDNTERKFAKFHHRSRIFHTWILTKALLGECKSPDTYVCTLSDATRSIRRVCCHHRPTRPASEWTASVQHPSATDQYFVSLLGVASDSSQCHNGHIVR